jgi:DNA adenine methylase
MTNRTVPHAFLKWCGGKGRMIGHIIPRMPEKINTYYEPFLGGGAIFFELARQKRFDRAVIGECNDELINIYKMIQEDVEGLILELKTGDYEYNKPNYLRIRAINTNTLSDVGRAARFMYLNKTAFNGLHRVNKKGQFNVPFGKYTNPVICDEINLRAVSDILMNVQVCKSDFEQIINDAKEGDVVYFDPPYMPVSKTSKFTSYTVDGFTEADQRRLAACFDKLVSKNICTVLSNSYTPLIMELYGKYKPTELMGARVVGGPASYRKPSAEIVCSAGLKL